MDVTNFVVGEQYTNRKGTYTVLAVRPPNILVRYEDGAEETLSIAVQQRILSNMTLPPRTPEPPPRRRTGPVARTTVATASAPAAPKSSVPRPARATTPAAPRTRRGAAPALPSTTLAQLASMTGKDQQRARQEALQAALSSPEAFGALADRSREAERGRLQVLSVEHIARLQKASPPPTSQTPDQLLSYAIAQNRAYLLSEGQDILTWHFPLYEGGEERYAIDLLCHDEKARRAMLVCVNTKTTARRWLWEALVDSLRNWAAVTATAEFPAALEGYVVDAPPAIVVLGPQNFWAENASGAGANTDDVAAGHLLNRRLLAAIEDWLRLPVLLLQVPDDWLRTVDQLDSPRITTALFSRGLAR